MRPKGFKHNLETRKKIADSHKGVKLSIEHRLACSKAHIGNVGGMLGKKHTEQAKNKMSISHIGYKHTLEARHNMSKAQRGLKKAACSEETKRKISETKTGVKLSKEHSEAISASLKGRIPSLQAEDYIFHHKDLNHFNDDQDNLQIMTVREHSRLHTRLCNDLIGKNKV